MVPLKNVEKTEIEWIQFHGYFRNQSIQSIGNICSFWSFLFDFNPLKWEATENKIERYSFSDGYKMIGRFTFVVTSKHGSHNANMIFG